MDLLIAEEASQLLRKKIILEQDLQKLLDKSQDFKIGLQTSHQGLMLSYLTSISGLSINSNQEFINKLKYLTILEIEKQIEKITDQIKSLKYY